MMLKILVSGPKQPGDRIDVYLRPLVDDLKILWKPGVPEEEMCSLPTLLGRYLRNMAKTFKEIHIYGAPSFRQQETSILGHGLSV
jgi:hypothetical protein